MTAPRSSAHDRRRLDALGALTERDFVRAIKIAQILLVLDPTDQTAREILAEASAELDVQAAVEHRLSMSSSTSSFQSTSPKAPSAPPTRRLLPGGESGEFNAVDPAELYVLDEPMRDAVRVEQRIADSMRKSTSISSLPTAENPTYHDPSAAYQSEPPPPTVAKPPVRGEPDPLAATVQLAAITLAQGSFESAMASYSHASGSRPRIAVHIPTRVVAIAPRGLDAFTERVFMAVDGQRSMLAIASRVGTSPEEIDSACSALRSLESAGAITLDPK